MITSGAGRASEVVRVDHTERKLDAFFVPTIQVGGAPEKSAGCVVSQRIEPKEASTERGVVIKESEVGVVVKRKAPPTQAKQRQKKRRKINLNSIGSLLDRLYQRQHNGE